MKSTIFLFFLQCFSLLAQPNRYQVWVKVHTNDCINCIIGGKRLTDLPASLPLYFLFKDGEEDFAKKLVQDNFSYPVSESQIKASTSLFHRYKTNETTLFVMFNAKPILSMPLKDLPNKLEQVKNYAYKNYTIDTLSVGSGLILGVNAGMVIGEQKAYFQDYLTRSVYSLDLKTGSVEDWSWKREDFSQNYPAERLLYQRTVLQQMGKDKSEPMALSVLRQDTLLALVSVPLAEKQGDNLLIVPSDFMVVATAKDQFKSYPIQGIPSAYSLDLDQIPTFDGENAILGLVLEEEKTSKTPSHALFTLSEKGELLFKEVLPEELPSNLKKVAYARSKAWPFSQGRFYAYSKQFLFQNTFKQIGFITASDAKPTKLAYQVLGIFDAPNRHLGIYWLENSQLYFGIFDPQAPESLLRKVKIDIGLPKGLYAVSPQGTLGIYDQKKRLLYRISFPL